MTLKQKIDAAIGEALPSGSQYSFTLTKTGINDTHVLRITTNAWKTLPAFIRIVRIQNALREALTVTEQQKILRVNVFSSDELKQILLRSDPAKSFTKKPNSELLKKIAAALKKNPPQKKVNVQLLKAALAKIHKRSGS